jgi:4,5-dihydroxyphthalate decarboxylase
MNAESTKNLPCRSFPEWRSTLSDLKITIALGDYDQTRDLALGRVRPVGIDLTVLNFDVEEIFYRFYDRLEWDVSEFSMGMYTSAISRGDNRFIAIPVFPSRVFRHSGIYVRTDGKIKDPQGLIGKRVGIPQWSQTAGIYVRGLLQDVYGVPFQKIKWVQGGVNDPGRHEPAVLKLPEGVEVTAISDRSLNEMLVSGELDAVITARPPNAFLQSSNVKMLIQDYAKVEADYYRSTGIFPIMHTVAIRRDLYEANRWIARNLFVALESAKERSLKRLSDVTVAHVPLPWISDLRQRFLDAGAAERGGLWPYGLKYNKPTLEAFLRYAFEQGSCHRLLRPEEIFAPEALAEIPV